MLLIDHDDAERDIDALLAADPHNDTDAIGHHTAAPATDRREASAGGPDPVRVRPFPCPST